MSSACLMFNVVELEHEYKLKLMQINISCIRIFMKVTEEEICSTKVNGKRDAY